MGRVFITGVSSGLGLGLASVCLERGDEVYGLSRRSPAQLEGRPGFHFRSVDLSDLDSIRADLESLLGGVEELDLVVLNAGILGEIQDLRETPMDTIRTVMDVNVWSNKIICDWFFVGEWPRVKQVVAVSSGASVSGARGWSAYGVSKAALNMLVKLYAAEVPNTHFCALAPGLIDTDMQEYVYAREALEEKFPIVKRLRSARYTEAMPGPEPAARRLLEILPRLLKLPSGDYADIRKLPE